MAEWKNYILIGGLILLVGVTMVLPENLGWSFFNKWWVMVTVIFTSRMVLVSRSLDTLSIAFPCFP
jgi:hypothetical protein